MLTTKQIERLIGHLLTISTLLSAGFVLIGGILYLWQYGQMQAAVELHPLHASYTSALSFIHSAILLNPLGIIGVGILILIATQTLRVGFLICYYFSIKDYWFTIFSFFIFVVLIYSFFFRSQ